MKKNHSQGFSILFAILVSSIVLAIGASLANKAARELIFASSGKESQKAFYSADTGLECAFYLDKKDEGVFATSTSYEQVSARFCDGRDITDPLEGWSTSGPDESGSFITTFSIDGLKKDIPDSICVSVTVKKTAIIPPAGGLKFTTSIESRGYNTCNVSDPRRVERALRATYKSTK